MKNSWACFILAVLCLVGVFIEDNTVLERVMLICFCISVSAYHVCSAIENKG